MQPTEGRESALNAAYGRAREHSEGIQRTGEREPCKQSAEGRESALYPVGVEITRCMKYAFRESAKCS